MAFTLPVEELEFSAARSGGPGGQHVQTTSSKVTVRWNVLRSRHLTPLQKARIVRTLSGRMTGEGVVTVSSQTGRSQHQNKAEAIERLTELVTAALAVPVPRRPTRPTRASHHRRLEGKRVRKAVKTGRRKPSAAE